MVADHFCVPGHVVQVGCHQVLPASEMESDMEHAILTSTYGPLFDALRAAKRRVTLFSPFISSSVAIALSEIAMKSNAKWTLVTNLSPGGIDSRYLSVEGLRKLREADVELRHLSDLHAKAFLVDDTYFVGSGNLTSAGLGDPRTPRNNRELGVTLSDAQISATDGVVADWLNQSNLISPTDLERAEELAKLMAIRASTIERELEQTVRVSPTENLWIKLNYGPPTWGRWRKQSFFANSRKSLIAPGDLVVIASNDRKVGYAIVEVTSEPRHDPQMSLQHQSTRDGAERWPWVSTTEPWLVPPDGIEIPYSEIGVAGQSLRRGYKRMGAAEFSRAVDVFTDSR